MPMTPSRARISQSVFLLLLLSLLLITLSVQAQDETVPIPTEQVFEIPLLTEESALPTEAPTEIPAPTDEAAPTALPTVEITPIATDEATPITTQEPTAVPTDEAASPALPTLPLFFTANFDTAYPADLSAKTGWLDVAVADGKALQSSLNASQVVYTPVTFIDGAVETRFALNVGEGSVLLRGYAASLSADGSITLYRNQTAVTSSTVTLTPDAWAKLRLEVIGVNVRISVDDTLMIDYTDDAPLPEGQAGFAASSDAVLRVDDFAIYGIPTTISSIEPAPQETLLESDPPHASALPLPTAVTCTPSPNIDLTMATQRSGVQSTASHAITAGDYALSGNGRYVAFLSTSSFGEGTDTNTKHDLFRFDRQTCTTLRVTNIGISDSVAHQGLAISDDGNIIAFAADTNSLVASTSTVSHIYVANVTVPASITFELISQTGAGVAGQGNAASSSPALSSDGRYVAFWSSATNLVAGDTNTSCEIDDARPHDNDDNCRDVFRYDRTTDTIVRVSLADNESQSNGDDVLCMHADPYTCHRVSGPPSVSDDGNLVAFASHATNLVTGQPNIGCSYVNGISGDAVCSQVYVRNISAGTTIRVSVSASNAQGNGASFAPILSANGRFVLFSSFADNLNFDGNFSEDIYLRDLQLGTTTRMSVTGQGYEIPAGGQHGHMSDDARYVTFTSNETSGSLPILSTAASHSTQVFVLDRATGLLVRASQTAAGGVGSSNSSGSQVSNDGTRVLFASEAANLVSGDANATADLFTAPIAYLTAPATPTAVNVAASGANVTVTWTPQSGIIYEVERYVGGMGVVVGRVVGGTFTETGIGCGLTLWYQVRAIRISDGQASDVSARMMVRTANCTVICPSAASVQRVAMGNGGKYQTDTVSATEAALSDDGRYITFTSNLPLTDDFAAELAAEGEPAVMDIYRYDTQTCTTVKLTVSDTEGETLFWPTWANVSPDGLRTYFKSEEALAAGTAGQQDIYVRTPADGTTTRVPSLVINGQAAITRMTDDSGRYVLVDWYGADSNLGFPTEPASQNDLLVYDTQDDSYQVVTVTPDGLGLANASAGTARLLVSGGHLYVVFSTFASNLVANDTNNRLDIFVRDLDAETTYRLSLTDDESNLPQAVEFNDAVIHDGTLFVSFETSGANIVPGLNTVYRMTYLRTVALNNLGVGSTTLISRADGVNGDPANGLSTRALLSADGRFAVFSSTGSNLVAGDTNGKSDAFVRDLVNKTTIRASHTAAGAQLTGDSYGADISASGGNLSVLISAQDSLDLSPTLPLVCETDLADSQPDIPFTQYNYADPCMTLFLVTNTVEQPLSAPSQVAASSTGTSVTVTWADINSDEAFYEVERYVSSSETALVGRAVGSATSFSEIGVGCGLTLWYRVRVVQTDGDTSDWSAWVMVSTAPCAPATCSPYSLIQRISVGTNSTYQTNEVVLGSGTFLSDDARYITFESRLPLTSDIASETTAEPEPATSDVYRYDTLTCTTVKVSVSDASQSASESTKPARLISAEGSGSTLYFETASPGLVAGDIDEKVDIFARTPASNQTVRQPSFNPPGLYRGTTLYLAEATRYHLVQWDQSDAILGYADNPGPDLLLYDRIDDDYEMITVTPNELAVTNGTNGHLFVENGVVYVIFNSDSTQIVAGDATVNTDIFLRDTSFDVSYRLSLKDDGTPIAGDAILLDALIKDEVIYIVFAQADGLLYLRTIPLMDVFTPTSGTTQIISRADGVNGTFANGASSDAILSEDGHFVIFSSLATNLITSPADTNGKQDVFVRDLFTNTTRRVSVTAAGAQLTGASTALDINSDGTRILFASEATTLVAGDSNVICEVDNADSYPTLPGVQYNYHENCADVFLRINPAMTLPAAPTSVTASTNLPDSIHITWAVVAGSTGYVIDQSTDNGATWAEAGRVDASTLAYDIDELVCNLSFLVRVRTRKGTLSSLPSASVNAATQPCPPPTLLTLANGAITSDSTPELTWSAVGSTTLYELTLSPLSTFMSYVPGYPKQVASTSYTSAAPLADGTYYWRVRTLEPNTSAYSMERSFTIDTVSPEAPVPSAPSNLAIMRTPRPTFTWGASTGAVKYTLQLDNDADFSSPVEMGSINLPGTTFTPAQNLDQGQYVWRVIAYDNTGNPSPASTTMTLTINPALTPAPNTVINLTGAATSADVTFTWAASLGATGTPTYTVQLDEADQGDFATPLALTCSTNLATALTCFIDDVPSGAYVWRVLRNGEVPVSVVSNAFFVSPAAPRAPRQVTPLNGKFLTPSERTSIELTWDWGTTAAPAGDPFTYEIEVSTSSTFAIDPAYVGTSATQTKAIGTLPDGTYYWRVRAINAYDVPGAWGTGFRFIVDNLNPETPSIISPAADVTLATARPTFSWLAVADAYRYELEVNNVCGDGTPLYSSAEPFVNIATTTFTIPATAILPQGKQQVCVRAYDLSQNPSDYSAARDFTIFLGTGPLNGVFIAPTVKPTFTWAATAGTTALTLEYDTDTDFNTGATSLPVTGVTKTLAAALPAGTYYWRVLRSGEMPATNVYRTFYVGALGAALTPNLPALGAKINTSTASLGWLAATPPTGITLTGYEIQVSTSATFATGITTLTSATNSITYPNGDTLPPNQNSINYYWRVRGLNNGLPVTNWGTSRFILDNVGPTAPTIVAPTAGAILATVRPTFTWGAVAGVTRYIVGLESLTAPVTENVFSEQPVTVTSFAAPLNLPQGDYRVRVRTDDGLNLSAWSYMTFRVRLGNTPAQGSVVTINRPTFTWTAVPGVTGYELQIDDDETFNQGTPDSTILYTIPLGNVVTYTLAQALPANGYYYWRIKPNGGTYPADFGSKMFSYGSATKPSKLEAHIGTSTGTVDTLFNRDEANPIVLTWLPPAAPPVGYEVFVSAVSTFATSTMYLVADPSVNEVIIPANSLPDGLKYWRVKAVFSTDRANFAYSDAKSFTLDTAAPAAPVSTAAMSTIVTTRRPAFTWAASATAVRYRLTVIDTTTGQPLTGLNNLIVATTSYVLPTTLAPLVQSAPVYRYDWKVEAEDAAGNISESFLVRHLGVFVGTAPAAALLTIDTTPVFTWTAVAGAGASPWTLEIATDAGMNAVVRNANLAPGAATYTLPNAQMLAPGRYFWRVRYASETTLEGRSFYVITSAASVTPVLAGPPTNDVINAAEMAAGVSFTWNPFAPALPPTLAFNGNYLFEVATTSTFTPASIKTQSVVMGATTKLWPTSAVADGTYYWRVRAILGANEYGPSSAVRVVRVDATPPGAAVLKTPIANAVIANTRTPVLAWTAATGTPSQYTIEIDNDESFSSLVVSRTVAVPTVVAAVPPANALANGSYWWRVVARDAAGNISTSEARKITIAMP